MPDGPMFFYVSIDTLQNYTDASIIQWRKGVLLSIEKLCIKLNATLTASQKVDWIQCNNTHDINKFIESPTLRSYTNERLREAVFYKATRYGDNSTVNAIFEQNANFNINTSFGDLPAVVAAYTIGQHKMAKYLIENKAADPNACDENGDSLLHLSTDKGDLAMIELLLKHQVLVNYGIRKSPLHFAAQKGYAKIVEKLIEAGSDIDHYYDVDGPDMHATPLIIAIFHKHLNVVKTLLAYGANSNLPYLSFSPKEYSSNNHKITNILKHYQDNSMAFKQCYFKDQLTNSDPIVKQIAIDLICKQLYKIEQKTCTEKNRR